MSFIVVPVLQIKFVATTDAATLWSLKYTCFILVFLYYVWKYYIFAEEALLNLFISLPLSPHPPLHYSLFLVLFQTVILYRMKIIQLWNSLVVVSLLAL